MQLKEYTQGANARNAMYEKATRLSASRGLTWPAYRSNICRSRSGGFLLRRREASYSVWTSHQSMKNLPTLTGDGGRKPKDRGSNNDPLDVASKRLSISLVLLGPSCCAVGRWPRLCLVAFGLLSGRTINSLHQFIRQDPSTNRSSLFDCIIQDVIYRPDKSRNCI